MKLVKIIFIYLMAALVAEAFVKIGFPEYKSLRHGIGVTGGIPFKLNSYNLRDDEFDFDKKDKYRILCLGDSITFGAQNRLEDIYPKVLERFLNSNNRGNFHVLNAGGIGGNTYFAYEYLKRKGVTFKPDYFILGLCLNDIGNNYFLKEEEKKGLKKFNFWENLEDCRIYKDSLKWDRDLPLAVNLKAKLNRLRWDMRSKSYSFAFIEVNLLRFMYRAGIKKYSFDLFREKEQMLCFGVDDASDEAWEMLFTLLIDMRGFLNERNIGFMVVVFPYEFQLSDEVKDNFFNIDKTKFTINPQQKLLDFGRKNSILVLDLLPHFRKSNKKLFFPLDYAHPTAHGHEIAAREIYNSLVHDLRPSN